MEYLQRNIGALVRGTNLPSYIQLRQQLMTTIRAGKNTGYFDLSSNLSITSMLVPLIPEAE